MKFFKKNILFLEKCHHHPDTSVLIDKQKQNKTDATTYYELPAITKQHPVVKTPLH